MAPLRARSRENTGPAYAILDPDLTATAPHHVIAMAGFDAIAQRWRDPHGEFRPLHALNPVRLDYVDSRASLAGKHGHEAAPAGADDCDVEFAIAHWICGGG